jgi:hypothetical protein
MASLIVLHQGIPTYGNGPAKARRHNRTGLNKSYLNTALGSRLNVRQEADAASNHSVD